MSKFRRFNCILRILAFLLLAAIGFHYVDRVLMAKDGEELSPYYYDYPSDYFDVIIAGPSVMKNGVQPVELWQDYGIAAYNLSCGNQSLACSYYILKDAISKDHPQLIVLDVTYAEEIYITRSNTFVHYLTDMMPLTDRYRYQLIQEVISEDQRMEFYLPFYSFHSRWKEVTASDFKLDNYQKDTLGSVTYAQTVSYDAVPFQNYDVDASLSDISREYLEKIISLCQENDTQLLFTCCPVSSANGDCDERSYNSRRAIMQDVSALAVENDVPFLNFLENPDALQLDAYKDFWDGIHLNMYGSAKLTTFLGTYIRNNYDIPDRSTDSKYTGRLNKVVSNYVKTKRSQAITTVSRTDVCMEVLEQYRRDDDLLYVIEGSELDSSQLSEEITNGLRKLGLTLSVSDTSADSSSNDVTSSDNTSSEADNTASQPCFINYLAVIDGGTVVQEEESLDGTAISWAGTTSDCRISLQTSGYILTEDTNADPLLSRLFSPARNDAQETSALVYEDKTESLLLQGGNYVGSDSGLHIAVYNKSKRKLIDCITISADGTSLTHWKEAGN
jgi:hypothetical protein